MSCIPQLRVRTEYSFRNAYGSPERYAARLEEMGCGFAAMVDTRGTWGHVDWEKALTARGIEPGFGTEFTIPDEHGNKPRCWVLATHLPSFYRLSSANPTTPEQLANAEGVIRFSGAALLEHPEAVDYIDINPRSMRQTLKAVDAARRHGKPLVITSDNEYPGPEQELEYLAWEDSKKRTPQYLLDGEGLRAALWYLDDETFQEAVANTWAVAEQLRGQRLRAAPIIHVEGDLDALVERGRQARVGAGQIPEWTDEYQQRMEREMEMIRYKEYESYFLVVADLVNWAKQHMLVGPARGSSAGSLVCYLTGITEVDPLVHGLIFERFIDINRADLPDIDIDFNDQKRYMVFDYLAEKYGAENVAHIGNVIRLKPRSVIAHAGKKLGIPKGATFAVTNVLIEYSSGDSRYGKGLEDTLNNTDPGLNFQSKYPESWVMGSLENHASHTGVHAAGIIVSNEPVVEYCTVRDGIAQVDKGAAEYLNLLKIDALGLRTLGVIEDSGCVTNEELYSLTLDDPAVLDIFNQRKFSGVFQFEGAAQRRVSMQVPTDSFKKIDHVTALARPGPLGGGAAGSYIARNAGEESIEYKHPSMAEYLDETMGVVLYQEQVMRIVRELGQFSWEETSVIRKAMSGRKGKEFFDRRGEMFAEGAAEQGIDRDLAMQIWEEICSFGAWGMNKSVKKDTVLKLCHPNQHLGSNPTIEEVYNYYKVNPSNWIRQRKAMPKLLSVDSSGVAKPRQAVDITYNGKKRCVKLSFSNGASVECSYDHKFVINGRWQRCGDAVLGDEFESSERKSQIKDHSFNPGVGKGWRKGRQLWGAEDEVNGRFTKQREFRASKQDDPCERCGEFKKRMTVHHNDHCHGKERPDDMAWVCDGCHKRIHIEAGDWQPPYARGWSRGEPAVLVSMEDAGVHDTYDIHMPAPDHNYVLANGIVTHNSHTVSYAMISYWCAYMKHHHPMEYAAASLRSAKDDEQVLESLRELNQEGVEFIPFDPDLSDHNWAAKDGKLVGGFTNLNGVGPVKAAHYVNKREQQGLTDEDRAKLAKLEPRHKELYEGRRLWGHIYDDPDANNIRGQVKLFSQLEDKENGVVIAKMMRRERRDENETVRAARRGYEKAGQTLFLDCFMVDDSVTKPVIVRLKPKMWSRLGKAIADDAVDGQDWFLIRGFWLEQFSMMIVDKIKCLTNPSVTEV